MPRRSVHRGFSLVEMVMVTATIGIIMMIAVPRMTRAADDAQASAIVANIRVLQNAIDMYAAEHNNLNPAQDADKSVSTNGARFAARLMQHTDEVGSAGGLYGPYLLRVPRNPGNGRTTIRIDGAAAGADLAGWRFNSTTGRIYPDHLSEAVTEAIVRLRVVGGTAKSLGELGATVVTGPE